MELSSVILISLALTAQAAPAKKPKPELVVKALEIFEACDHWYGEMGDQSDDRNSEILAGIAHDCPEAKTAVSQALKAHPNDPDLADAALSLAENSHYDLTKTERTRLCRLSLPSYRRHFAKTKNPDWSFSNNCPEQAKSLYGKRALKLETNDDGE